MNDDPTRLHVRRLLEARLLDGADLATRLAEIEADGGRIVNGGQTGSYEADGKAAWEVTDWRTGELLASGRSAGPDGMDEVVAALDPENCWHFIDGITMDDELSEVVTEGIPVSLGIALDEWVGSISTSDEDIADFVGWPVDKVRNCRSD